MKFLVIGEAMAEIRKSQDADFKVGIAGDTYNTAVYCARALGQPNAVGYMTRLGTDPLSKALQVDLEAEGIECSASEIDQHHNLGIYSVSTDKAGERSFHYWRSQSAARKMFSVKEDLDHLDKAEIIYLSGITMAILSHDARARLMKRLSELSDSGKALVAFDSNYRPNLWEDMQTAQAVIRSMWNIADIALPSIDDEMHLFDESAEDVIDRFSSRKWFACAIKRGEEGPLSPELSSDEYPVFLPAENVVDTTAAGDSFNAGFLAALIEKKSRADCLQSGHELARAVVQIPGAIAPLSAENEKER